MAAIARLSGERGFERPHGDRIFTGTAGQIRDAFHTEIHRYTVNNEDHWANSSDPQIPTALALVVAGVDTLYNFPRQQMHEVVGVFSRTKATGAVKPAGTQFTFPNPCNPTAQPFCNFAVAPADFAKIYDVPNLLLSPAPASQFNGDGISIAVVSQSDINTQDVSSFRSLFGLPAPKLNIILNGPDPGFDPGGAETEADLDVQWAGAVAPNATIDLVISQSTEISLGADLSAQYAVDNNLAPVLNESFGLCEFFIGTSGNTFYNQVWQQAAAQGITVTVSSGDGGSAGCDRGAGAAVFGLAVSGFTSTPYNVSVGGTDFNDINNFSQFWNTTPSDTPTVASAKGYITEMTWNDSCTNQEIFSFFGVSTAEQACNNANVQADGLVEVVGGSGGKSGCTTSDGENETSCGGGYAKPSWQTALTPNDGKRDVPDVSLFASSGFNSSFYLICEADFPGVPPGAPSCDPYAPVSDAIGLGGTSASSPAFAAIMALVNQATVSRQGNANYILYKLAAQTGASCTSAASPASTCVFYDVPSGSTIAMPCTIADGEAGSTGCTISNRSDSIGVLSGYATTAGYDLATGLGSVNAANLVSKWTTFEGTLKSSTTSLTLNSGSPVTITHGQSVSVNIGVTGAPGTPSGNVSLVANTAPPSAPPEVTQQGVQSFALTSGSVTSNTNLLPGGQNYSVIARYPGDGTFKASDSTPVNVTVNPEASQSSFALELFDPSTGIQTNPNATTAQYGAVELLRINVTSQSGDTCAQNAPGQSGCPTGSVTVTNNSAPLDAGTYQLNIQGYAEDQTVELPGGTDVLKVTYPGDNSFNASNGTDTITVTKAPTTTAVNSFSSFVTFGSAVNIGAAVSSTGFGQNPTGQITFFSSATQLGSPVTVSGTGSTGSGTPQAQATINTSQLPLGADSVTAQYNGDGNYAASTSSPVVINVQIPTNVTISSTNLTINHGSSVTFTAHVTPTLSGGPGPTGSVVFTENGNSIGTVQLASGQAQITTATLPGGTLTISAQYSGDTDYVSAFNSLTETVNLVASTTTVMTSNPSISQGTSVTLTATVAAVQSGGPALTGTVQFYSALSAQGSDNPVGSPVTLSNGQAQIATTALPVNTQLVVAGYSGDANYSGSTSAAITETVNPAPTFTISANPTTIPVSAPGAMGSTTLTFTAQNGFSSGGPATVTPACSGMPSETTCSSGASITIATNGTAMAMVTFLTTAPSTVLPASHNRPNTPGWRTITTAIVLACLLWMSLLLRRLGRKQRRWSFALVFTAFVLLAVSVGCGGGGGTTPPQNPGTPTGQYSISVMVTINGVTQSIPNLTLNVQ